ncbi:insulinase family protein [Candidatus Woesearchaeota archaeon]|nr:insulinase family protein [Candidatus Woesearchaeota archaeon]
MKLVRRHRLPNGMDLYWQPDEGQHLVGVGVKAGAFHDSIALSNLVLHGLAHYVEHSVARGADPDKVEYHERKLRSFGCGPERGINICTSHDYTFYGASMVRKRRYATELFDTIFAPMVTKQLITKEGMDIERAAIFTEYLVYGKDLADELRSELLFKSIYPNHPINNRIDCEEEDLKRISPYHVKKFISEFYVPNIMFAILLGPSFEKAKQLVYKHFGDLQPKEVPQLQISDSQMRPILSGVHSTQGEKAGLRAYYVAVGFPTMPYGYEGDEDVEVLSEIMEYKIEEALREKNRIFGQGTYRPFSQVSRSKIHGTIYFTFETPEESFVDEGIERIIKVCETVKNKGVDHDVVEKAVENLPERRKKIASNVMKRRMRTDFIKDIHMGKMSCQNAYLEAYEISPDNLTDLIINEAVNGDESMKILNTYPERIAKVNAKSVWRVANEYLTTPHNFALSVVKPIPGTQEVHITPDFYNQERKQLWLPFK